eukprot:Seg1413.7 transcript_id=Seg1413.7/GoldUCD/mRNA.D3Y31 product="hypothetical protein" protein_id=Seg1413.7/GoldUCD/D3Y31
MEDGRKSDQNGELEKQLQASNLIAKALQIFLQPSTSSGNTNTTNATVVPTAESKESTTTLNDNVPSFSSASTISSRRQTASEEPRAAFAPYNRQAYQFARFGRGGAKSSYRPSSKRADPFANTWTHKFCLVPFKDQLFTPTLTDKDSWKEAGLGEKVVTLNKNGDHQHIEQTLEDAFPKLKGAGGFMLLRSGVRSNGGARLEAISIPYGGYSVPYLKYDSPLRSATCFIRPLQQDLPLHSVRASRQGESAAVGRRVSTYDLARYLGRILLGI